MSAVDAGLLTAVALLLIAVAALLRAQAATARRLEQLERRLSRADRRPSAAKVQALPGEELGRPAPGVVAETEGDAVDVAGVTPDGATLTIPLETPDEPVLLVFLSTTCGICTSIWERLRDAGLPLGSGVRPVVVTKDAPPEDLERIREMGAADQELTVVLSSEAWIDYEVPGSPYLMVVAGRPGSVVDEGSVTGWDGLAAMVGRVLAQQP